MRGAHVLYEGEEISPHIRVKKESCNPAFLWVTRLWTLWIVAGLQGSHNRPTGWMTAATTSRANGRVNSQERYMRKTTQ